MEDGWINFVVINSTNQHCLFIYNMEAWQRDLVFDKWMYYKNHEEVRIVMDRLNVDKSPPIDRLRRYMGPDPRMELKFEVTNGELHDADGRFTYWKRS